jgi:hypothetical protein
MGPRDFRCWGANANLLVGGSIGDPLDPYGDQHAMNEFWSLLKVDGILLLAIPFWPNDQLSHLLARLYGPIRSPWLTQGWECLGCVNRVAWTTRVSLKGDWGWHLIIALRKTSDVQACSSTCTLNCSDASTTCTLNCSDASLMKNKLLTFDACRASSGCRDLNRHWTRLVEFSGEVLDASENGDARKLQRPL